PLKVKADKYLFPRSARRPMSRAVKLRHAPRRRLSYALVAAFPRIATLAWDCFNSRWIMIAGYIDERRHVKKFAVCYCDFLKGSNDAGPGGADFTRVFVCSEAVAGPGCVSRGRQPHALPVARRPSDQRLIIIIRSATLLNVAGSRAQCSSSSRTRSKS